MRLLFALLSACVCALPSCQTTRTVLAGPSKISSGNSSTFNAEKEARSRASGQAAASAGVVGQVGQGDEAFTQRFGSFDPGGYIQTKTDPKNPKKSVTTYGLNYMSEKNFGGNLNSKDMKSFSQTSDFLTRKYDTTELYQKNSSSQGVKSWFGNKKAEADKQATESGAQFSGGSRVLANKTSNSDGRTVDTRGARENGRTADTKDFYPAKKAVVHGADAPKIIGEGSKESRDSVWRLIKSRPRDNPATVDEIRALLGKTD